MTDKTNNRRFLGICLLTLAFALLIMGTFNAIIDPHGLLSLIDREGFNSQKISQSSGSRVTKTVIMRNCDYRTVLFGSSRVLSGIAADSPALPPGPVFNMAFPGTNFREVRNAMRFVRRFQPKLETAIIGLDFVQFTTRMGTMDDNSRSPLAVRTDFRNFVPYLLSVSSARDSLNTLAANTRSIPADCSVDGSFMVESMSTDPGSAFRKTIKFFFTEPSLYADFEYSPERIAWLREELLAFASAGTRTKVFIPPMHAMQLMALDARGLWDDFEHWKRDVTRIVAEVNRTLPIDRQITLWDFTGYYEITTEQVPFAGGKMMLWWSDSSHFKEIVGDMVLERMRKNGTAKPIQNFGRILTPANIEATLLEIRRNRDNYAAANPDAVRFVTDLLPTN